MDIQVLHHVSLTVSHLERSILFYREILGLEQIPRPPFPFDGAWFRLGEKQELHLIFHTNPTYREGKGVDSRDVHFAARVKSYTQVLEFLRSKGYREDAPDKDLMKVYTNPHSLTGYPQLYIIDPDRHVIEINADRLD
jgi:catechol 2,3-dioxygenase-like lactoylglutathione lyase family enzyme